MVNGKNIGRKDEFSLLPKLAQLSPYKIVFDDSSTLSCLFCGKRSLIVAERGKNLRCFYCCGEFVDSLCVFCENGISDRLLSDPYVPSCLLGNKRARGWTRFCKDFSPGPPFGEDQQTDMRIRREKAEEVFAGISFENCRYCEHWTSNKKNALLLVGHIRPFCDVGCRIHEESCKLFRLAASKRTDYTRQRTQLPKYCEMLQEEERHVSEFWLEIEEESDSELDCLADKRGKATRTLHERPRKTRKS